MSQQPEYRITEAADGWLVQPPRERIPPAWQVWAASRQEAVELADHLDYEPQDNPLENPTHYERLADRDGVPTYHNTRKF